MQFIAVENATQQVIDFVKLGMKHIPILADKETNDDRLREIIQTMADSAEGICVVAVDDEGIIRGMIMGQCMPELYTFDKIAMVILWFCPNNPRLSKVLSDLFNEWAKTIEGCKKIQYASPMVDKLSEYYLRKGFTEVERAYIKEI